jgi:exosortase family protein XrtG
MTIVLSGLLFVVWCSVAAFLRFYRIWLLYYVLGAGGCAYWLVLGTSYFFQLDLVLAQSVSWSVHQVARLFDLPTRIFAGAPGTLMVMVITQEVGWTLFHIGVESSGLLELSVLTSLLLFYPGWTLRWRVSAIAIGLALTWMANVLRVLVITAMLHTMGKNVLVLAHTFVGKALFFSLIVAICWYLVTTPTLRFVRARLQHDETAR